MNQMHLMKCFSPPQNHFLKASPFRSVHLLFLNLTAVSLSHDENMSERNSVQRSGNRYRFYICHSQQTHLPRRSPNFFDRFYTLKGLCISA